MLAALTNRMDKLTELVSHAGCFNLVQRKPKGKVVYEMRYIISSPDFKLLESATELLGDGHISAVHNSEYANGAYYTLWGCGPVLRNIVTNVDRTGLSPRRLEEVECAEAFLNTYGMPTEERNAIRRELYLKMRANKKQKPNRNKLSFLA